MYHIGIGISSTVYAGTVRKLKDGNEVWIRKDDVTKEFLGVMVSILLTTITQLVSLSIESLNTKSPLKKLRSNL